MMKNPKKSLLYPGGLCILLVMLLTLIPGFVCADDLSAMFATAPSSGHAPINVSFIDQSEGLPVNWTWDYDDGTAVEYFTSNPNPSHTYTTPGSYYPSLVVDNNTKTPDLVNSTYTGGPVHVYPPLISANFSGIPRIGYAPLNVVFIDQSTGPVEHRNWNFDETNVDPATPHTVTDVKNPMHTYVSPGTYTVNFTVNDTYTSATATQSLITVYAVPPPDVEFSASPRSGTGPLEVSFTSIVNSTDPLSYEWDFGDGSPLNYEPHPVHTYTDADTYNVTLGVTGPGGETVVTKTEYIGVSSIPAPIADFAVAPSEGIRPLTVSFIGLANGTGTLLYTWDFGDGIGTGTGRNPYYTYNDAGFYNVTCTVSDGTKTGSVTRDYCVRVFDKPAPVAAFAASPTMGESPLNVTFIDISTGMNGTPVYSWNFGDGGSIVTTDKSYIHTYTTPGIRNPQLTVYSDGVPYTGPTNIFITITSPAKPEAMFAASPRNGTAPLEVSFIDQSTGKGHLLWDWDFGDNTPLSHIKNPIHIYEKPGVYDVTLMIRADNGQDLSNQTNFITVQSQPLPHADFTATPISGSSPLTVSFIDQSTGEEPLQYEWDFGDSSSKLYVNNPVHTYSSAGNYTVKLIVTNNAGSSTAEKEEYIQVDASHYPDAAFSVTPGNGTAPLTVTFIDQSRLNPMVSEPPTYLWTFGDGNSTTKKNPSYTYEEPGIYQANLTVTHGGISDGPVNTTITVTHADDPVGMFTASPRNGTAPLTVNFIDQSKGTGPFTQKWDFGDGSPLSFDQNPVHEYKKPGVYNVSMQVTGSLGSDVVNQNDFIEVRHADDPVGMFTATPRNGTAPLTVSFIDQSKGTGPFTQTWDFGDGSPLSYDINPVHEFKKPGVYNVRMQVTGPLGSDIVDQNEYIKVRHADDPAGMFTASPRKGAAPLKVSFIDQSKGTAPLSYKWNFGDETPQAFIQNPVHEYTKPGIYNVSMQVTGPLGSDVAYLNNFIEVTESSYPQAAFTLLPKSGTVPLEVKFIDQSVVDPSGPAPEYLWDFGDGNTSSNQNPVWTYTKGGGYNVTLTVTQGERKSVAPPSKVTVSEYPHPDVKFSMAPVSGYAPLKVSFIDQTCKQNCQYEYIWEFGDGNSSTKKNPVWEYVTPGNYTVNLTVIDPMGISTKNSSTQQIECKEDNYSYPLIASFSAVPEYGNPPLKVTFVDTSNKNEPITYDWNFGDGSAHANSANVTHVFYKPDIYEVNLKIKGTKSGKVSEYKQYINIEELKASFTAATSGSVNIPIQFTNTSHGFPTRWAWEFGDGIASREENPVHTYRKTGVYSVNFTAANEFNSDIIFMKDYITII